MQKNVVLIVLCVVLASVAMSAQGLLHGQLETGYKRQDQRPVVSAYQTPLRLRHLHTDCYILCAQFALQDVPGEFLIDTGFKGPPVLNTWYMARYQPDVQFEDMEESKSVTQTKLPRATGKQDVTLQGIHGQKAINVGVHTLADACPAMQLAWSMSLPHAPHILTLDAMLQMQPLCLSVSTDELVVGPSVVTPDHHRPEQRWRQGLLELRVTVDNTDVWCVFDTGLSSCVYLTASMTQATMNTNMTDVNGITHSLPCKTQAVELAGWRTTCIVTHGQSHPRRRGYVGMGLLRHFDMVLKNDTLFLLHIGALNHQGKNVDIV